MAFLALVPSVLGRDWWNTWDYPERIMDQFFGMPLTEEDLLSPFNYHGFQIQPRTQASIDNSGKSEVKNEEKQFQVSLNLKHFKPEEIEVKVVDDYIVIHGKHEEKSDESGFCAREFTRRYMLPKACQSETVTSTLSPEGILTIVAPKKVIEEAPKKERKISVKVDEAKSSEKK